METNIKPNKLINEKLPYLFQHALELIFAVYPNQQTLSVKLSWSHYCELLNVSDENVRRFFEKEAILFEVRKINFKG